MATKKKNPIERKERKKRAPNKWRISSLINILRSNSFGVIILMASVILQGLISFYVFRESEIFKSKDFNMSVSLFYAVTVCSFITFYTLRNNQKMAIVILIVETFVNTCFDYLTVYKNDTATTNMFWIQIVMLGIIPASTYFLAYELNKGKNKFI